MIRRVAVVPHPPVLVPQLTAGGAEEIEPLRSACLAAAGWLADGGPRWVAVGAHQGPRERLCNAVGTFRGYGADITVALGERDARVPDPDLPLPALVAGWLRGRAAPATPVWMELVPGDLPAARCRALGGQLAAELAGAAPVGLLVLGDGAATHTAKAPGYLDERAAGFEAAARDALAAADPAALLGLDADLAAELLATGRAAWQVLAGAALATGTWSGQLLYSAAPYGVGYHVAAWER